MNQNRESFTPIVPNPFFVGTPVKDPSKFFGRQGDFDWVKNRLMAEVEGVVLVLVGARRSGKTSVLFQIINGKLGKEFRPIFIDMQQLAGINEDREFFRRMADLTFEGLGDERLVAEYYEFSTGNPMNTFDLLLRDIARAYPGQRLLFLVDEAELLETKVEKGELSGAVLTYMASILEKHRISFCLTGSPGMASMGGEDWRRLTAKGLFREISFLSRTDSFRLIQQPVEGRLVYAEGMKEEIFKLTAGWPFYVQLLCHTLVDLLNQLQRNRAELPDLEEVVATVVDNPPPQLVYQWDGLDQDAQTALSLLAEMSDEPHKAVGAGELFASIKANGYPLNIKADALNVALEHLYEGKHLERTADGAYFFRVDLFRQWVTRARSIWWLVGEQQAQVQPRNWGRWAVAGVAVFFAAAATWWALESEEPLPQPAAAPVPAVTTGHVRIESDPREVDVYIDGQHHKSGTTPILSELAVGGEHLIRLEREGYYTEEKKIVPREAKTGTLVFALKQIVGLLQLEVQPAGAKVSIEGEDYSRVDLDVPLEIQELPIGTYQVRVRQQGYAGEDLSVQIAAGETKTKAVQLRKEVGHLVLSSQPEGATVLLNGELVEGVTPLNLNDLPIGAHRLRFELADYQPHELVRRVEMGATVSVDVELTLQPAVVLLKSNPAGAAIYVDGAASSWGVTPKDLTLPPGAHAFSLVHEGYDPYEISGNWRPGQRDVQPMAQLVRQYGWLRISKPLQGTLFVDDKLMIKDGLLKPIRLPVGSHTLRLEDTGEDTLVYVYKDSTIIVRFQ